MAAVGGSPCQRPLVGWMTFDMEEHCSSFPFPDQNFLIASIVGIIVAFGATLFHLNSLRRCPRRARKVVLLFLVFVSGNLFQEVMSVIFYYQRANPPNELFKFIRYLVQATAIVCAVISIELCILTLVKSSDCPKLSPEFHRSVTLLQRAFNVITYVCGFTLFFLWVVLPPCFSTPEIKERCLRAGTYALAACIFFQGLAFTVFSIKVRKMMQIILDLGFTKGDDLIRLQKSYKTHALGMMIVIPSIFLGACVITVLGILGLTPVPLQVAIIDGCFVGVGITVAMGNFKDVVDDSPKTSRPGFTRQSTGGQGTQKGGGHSTQLPPLSGPASGSSSSIPPCPPSPIRSGGGKSMGTGMGAPPSPFPSFHQSKRSHHHHHHHDDDGGAGAGATATAIQHAIHHDHHDHHDHHRENARATRFEPEGSSSEASVSIPLNSNPLSSNPLSSTPLSSDGSGEGLIVNMSGPL